MCYRHIHKQILFTRNGYDVNKLLTEQEFNQKNLEKLNHSLQEDS